MNIFKKSRKSKDDDDVSGPIAASDGNGFTKASRALTRRRKKDEIEEKPVFDLSSALPDRDEFRTSLLMPNLSARFSMLREQDDPNTKIGKASDDSVLFPKQTMRHNLLNGNFLSDIAEVESIYSTFRPPFADEDGKGSSDGYASDDGSIMNRARPVETNNLFGGRQKLYKVVTTSSTGLAGSKHVYDSDVSLSSFQRVKAKELSESDETTNRSSAPISDPGENDSVRSPLTGFNKNRGTQSSTNSGPSHRPASTAATSIVSESPVPQSLTHLSVNRAKEQDPSLLNDGIGLAVSPSLHKSEVPVVHRAATLPSYNTTSAQESGTQQTREELPMFDFDEAKPMAVFSDPIDATQKEVWKPLASPSRFQTTSPTSQAHTTQDDPLASNVRPNDRGKATAMGLFNKPARHYDEAQFTQRQMQLHQGRVSPPSTRSRSESCTSPDSSRQITYSAMAATADQHVASPPIPEQFAPLVSSEPLPVEPSVKATGSRPRTKSGASNKETSVKARLESLIRKQNEELIAIEAAHTEQHKTRESDIQSASSKRSTAKMASFYRDNDSDDEDPRTQPSSRRSSRPSTRSTRIHNPPAPLEIHPAFRQDYHDFDFGPDVEQTSLPRNSNHSTSSKPRQSSDKPTQAKHVSENSLGKLDSPTVPTAGLGLSGLIRTHLRQTSNNSSMLAPPSPALLVDEFRFSVPSTGQITAQSEKSNPFEPDKSSLTVQSSPQLLEAPPTPTTAMSQQAQHMLGIATAIREANANANKTPRMGAPQDGILFEDQADHDAEPPNHQRNESTETEREQQRFEEELAARRQRIDANLQNIQERSRSRSPMDDRNGSHSALGFSLPRLPIKSNTIDRSDTYAGSKSSRMLAVSPPNRDHALNQNLNSVRQFTRPSPQPSASAEHEGFNGRRTPIPRPSHRTEIAHERPIPSRSITPSTRPDTRNRSASAADRSVSRNEHLMDYDPMRMPGAFPGSPGPRRSPPRERGYRPESPAHARSYERSASRTAGQQPILEGNNNFKGLSPPHANRNITPRPSPRPSPNPTHEVFNQNQMARPMSPPSSALPSPNPTAVGNFNGRTTPTALPGRVTPSGTRKKSVTKGMISDPTFVSSTSSVPLVYLPRDGGPPVEPVLPPPVPAMNPRRRVNTPDDQPSPGFSPHPGVRPYAVTTPTISEPVTSPDLNFNSSQASAQSSRQRNKLRKSSSEGGNMAARARQQALMAEMAREKERSPNVAVFPNRSATSLATPHNGNMF